MRFEIHILGCGSAVPSLQRNASAQYLNVHERHLLIDCAEGTQLALRKAHAPLQRLNAVFISHLHGDHYLGLMGLLSTMHLLGRQKPLLLYGPPELIDVLKLQWHVGRTTLRFDLQFTPLKEGEVQELYEDEQIRVKSFPLRHRIPCWGFRVDEKPRRRKIRKEELARYRIPLAWIKRIIDGEDYPSPDGRIIPNEVITQPPLPPRSYAYCSDTAYDERIVPNISGVHALYHEATFTEAHRARAKETYHSTSAQAAMIAKLASVKHLYIGHYSARYRDTEPLVTEARDVFEATTAAEDGDVIRL
ncbi:MAG: ribonuclease Z [Cryomorphaceae bacterium]|nr:MAG: ribonuclease Z [Cryomorphaceae bacterium]